MITAEKKLRIQKYGEVFTPQSIVDQMCDMLEKENPRCYQPETTFLEPTCGDGVFVMEILRRKFANCKRRADYTACIKSVYAMEIQSDNVQKTIDAVTELCKEHFKPTKDDLQSIKDHIILADSLKIMRMINDMNEREKQVKVGAAT